MTERITKCFEQLKAKNSAGFIPFVTAGDPGFDSSLDVVKVLPELGADIIELGMPFSDPMADGPAIQKANLRALRSGITMRTILNLVASFRKVNDTTPVILMGYYNPVYSYGVKSFLRDCSDAGVDGLIIVDLPPEHDDELCLYTQDFGLDFVRLVAPTTGYKRLPKLLDGARGFVYYISITGITGTQDAPTNTIENSIAHLRQYTRLPIAVGFGVKTLEQAAAVSMHGDATVIGSIIVDKIASMASGSKIEKQEFNTLKTFIRPLGESVHTARVTR